MTEDFFSFDEALSELRLKEEELKRLVSEGEIRAFRKGDTMKLRRSDVESLRSELSGGEVVDLGDLDDELVFEDDADLEDEAGMATAEIADVDTLIEEIEDVGELDTLELDEIEELDEETEEVAGAFAGASAAARRRPAGPAATVSDEEPELVSTLGMLGIFATTAVLLLLLPLALALKSGYVSGFARAVAGLFQAEIPQ